MAQLIRTNGTIEPWTDLTLEGLRKAVGGYIEVVYTHTGHQMVINEEGKIHDLPLNPLATAVYIYGHYDLIVGDVVIMDKGEELD